MDFSPGHAPANFAYAADTKRKTTFHLFFASAGGLRLPRRKSHRETLKHIFQGLPKGKHALANFVS